MSPTVDRVALRAFTSALAGWTGEAALPETLRPAAFGLHRPGGAVEQLPFGPEAAEALRTSGTLARYLDHTLLKADATPEEVRALGAVARAHQLGGACVHALQVRALADVLQGSAVTPIAVVGFPQGAHRLEVKALEARLAVMDGARELDAVAALGLLRAGEVEASLAEMQGLVEAARPWPVKLILETGLLNRRAVVLGATLALVSGCAAVKTSTGVGSPGARVEDVALLRAVVGEELAVKASGGVRSREQALTLVAAGASRLGTSVSLSLLAEVGSGPPFTIGH